MWSLVKNWYYMCLNVCVYVLCVYIHVMFTYFGVWILHACIVIMVCVCVCVCVCACKWYLLVHLLVYFVMCCVEAAEKKELERKKLEEKATLKKLQKLIEKEREKRNKKPKARKTKRCIVNVVYVVLSAWMIFELL